jgi:predicted double-glycine peptidase
MFASRGAVQILLAAAALATAAPAAHSQAAFNLGSGLYRAPVTSLRDMPFRTVVRQQYDFSCGSAALATLLHYHYGLPINEGAVFQAMYAAGDQPKIQRVGFSMLDMKNYLKTQGFEANGYRRNAAELRDMSQPAIALIRVGSYRHFVVVKGVRADKVLVGDPAQGIKVFPLAEFERAWNGILFVVDQAPGRSPAFNKKEEWASLQHGPFEALDDRDLAAMTRDLPPLYQITVSRELPGAP